MNAIRTLLAAAFTAVAGASAFAAPLSVVNQGESFAVRYEEGYTANIVGGGSIQVAGQGESQQVSYADPGFADRAPGLPVFVGGSEGEVAYLPQVSAIVLATR